MYEHYNFEGRQYHCYLSEFNVDKFYNVPGFIQDRTSSVKWFNIPDYYAISLYEDSDGRGKSYNKILPGTGEDNSLSNSGFNDIVTSWKYFVYGVVKEEILDLKIENVSTSSTPLVVNTIEYTNNSSSSQTVQMDVSKSVTETITVSWTETETTTTSVSFTASIEFEGIASASTTTSLTREVSCTHGKTTESSTTINYNYSIPITVSAGKKMTGTAIIYQYNSADVPYDVTLKRYFSHSGVSGSVKDDATGYWVKTYQDKLKFSGTVFSKIYTQLDETNI